MQIGFGFTTAFVLLAGLELDARAYPAYLRSAAGQPWGQNTNEQAMDLVFGAGGWDDLQFESVDAFTLFSPTYHFVYLDGSDVGADELNAFLGANQALIEAWVDAGGYLLLNAAPNEGGNQNWGFGGVTLNYPIFGANGAAADAAHPIWNGPNLPAATAFTGNSFGHATITGGVLSSVIVDSDTAAVVVAETPWGNGSAMFGGMTTSNWWAPQPDALDIRANMIAYLESGGGADADDDGIVGWQDNCPTIPNAGQDDADGNGTGDVCEGLPPAAYLRSEGGGPRWGQTVNEAAMDAVFGPGNWDDLRFEFVDPDALFSASYGFIYLEGSDGGADELAAFLSANQMAMEDWVNGGGRLFLNAAPNEGGNQAWGFGGVTLTVSDFGNSGTASDATHPIWNGPFLPVATDFTGNSFSHASLSGGGTTTLIVDIDASGQPRLAELDWGSGLALFGGLTTDNWWSPLPESHYLRENIIYYAAGGGVQDSDGDGVSDDQDNCPDDANAAQTDTDGDGQGDACDACPDDAANDADADGVCGDVDNCPADPNAGQQDADGDGVGDACDVCPDDALDDADGDTVCGDVDNCPDDANPGQEDADGDGVGDACDTASESSSGGGSSEGGSSGGGSSEGGSSEGGSTEGGTEADTSGSASASATGASATGASATSAGEESGGSESSETTASSSDDGGGCGCTTDSRAPAWWLGLVVLGLRRRRRAS
jgi:MYXO-CTERM domain-containing protein